jgi:hypothetical protein
MGFRPTSTACGIPQTTATCVSFDADKKVGYASLMLMLDGQKRGGRDPCQFEGIFSNYNITL